MKFKNVIAVLSSAALSLSMLASVNVSANTPGSIKSEDDTYSIGFDVENGGAVVKWIYESEGVEEVVIPEKTDTGIPFVGIDDLAFYECDDLKTIVLPDSIKADNIGDVAFLRREDVAEILLGNVQDMELSAGLTYAANTVEFMGKNDWKGDEEELGAAKKVLNGIKASAGYDDPETDEDDDLISLDQAVDITRSVYLSEALGNKSTYVREDGVDDTTKMSEKSFENFKAWVKVIPENITIRANEESDAAKNAQAKAILGVKFEPAATHVHLLGDANQDCVVNVRDCAKIANALAFKTVDQLACIGCADYNQDGEVTVRDAAQLANAIATGKIDTSKK